MPGYGVDPLQLADATLKQLIDELGARTPAPGGGAAASVTAAVGSALGAMVINWSLTRKSLQEHRESNQRHLDALQAGASRSLQLADEDARAYESLNTIMKLPEDDATRLAEWDTAVEAAMAPPVETLRLCAEMAANLAGLASTTNPMLKSDLAAAAVLVEAGGRTAAWNIHANLPLIGEARAVELTGEAQTLLTELRRIATEVEQACR